MGQWTVPQYHREDSIAMLRTIPGSLAEDFMDALVVKHVRNLEEEFMRWPHHEDVLLCGIVEDIIGRYWKIGVLNNMPCWRQEKNSGGGDGMEIFLWYCPSGNMAGWLWGHQLGVCDDSSVLAWSKPIKNKMHPEMIRIPFWQRTTNPLVGR